jgi:predicted PurR-regulated permease PerM
LPLPFYKQNVAQNVAAANDREISVVRGHILFAFGVALALALAWRLMAVLELVYVSALFAVVLMPMVQSIMTLRIHKWSPSRPVAIVALVAVVFGAIAGFLILGIPPVTRDVQHFADALPRRIPLILDKIKRLPLANRFGLDSLAQKSENGISTSARYLIASAPMWLGRLFDLFTAFFLCIYFMLEGEFVYFYFLSLFPIESRERLAKTLVMAEIRMSKWLIGQGALMLILGVCSIIAFALIHVRYFFLLGVLMGLFNIIPVAGGIITILLAGAVAATQSWTQMGLVFAFYAVYIQIENGYLTPRIMRSRVNLMGLSVLIALLAGSALAGIVGALVAVPTAALVAVIMDEYVVQKDAAAAQAATQEAAEAAAHEAAEAAKEAADQAERSEKDGDPNSAKASAHEADKQADKAATSSAVADANK